MAILKATNLTLAHRCAFCKKRLPSATGVKIHVQKVPACRIRWEAQLEGPRQSATGSRLPIPPFFEPPVENIMDGNPGLSVDASSDSNSAATERGSSTLESVEKNCDVNSEQSDIDSSRHTRFCQYYPPDRDTGVPAANVLRTGRTVFEEWEQQGEDGNQAPWSPFGSREEWELSRFMVKTMGQNKIEEFLNLDIIQKLGLQAGSKYKFNQLIDSLPNRSSYLMEEVTVTGNVLGEDGELMTEKLEVWYRNPVECIKELLGNPLFRDAMGYAPEKVYLDKHRKQRVYDEMWTADWWWDMQMKLPIGALVIPVILASDKTKLSQFRGDQVAWPVYLSIGNISKDTRRQVSSGAMILLGYIPVSKLECFSEDTRSLAGYRLFHHCMGKILGALEAAGKDGVEMMCADGCVRRAFPILAAYIADHPEQCLVVNVKENTCPPGDIDPTSRGEPGGCCMRNVDETLDLLARHSRGEEPAGFEARGLRPVYEPFWKNLPHTNIFSCLTPDILHQLHKGVFKDHLMSWITAIIGKDELDRRFRAMNDSPGLRHFGKGISHVQQWTGAEHKEMQKVVVTLLAGAVSKEVLTVVQSLVDFIYYAQFQLHTTASLSAMEAAYQTFHRHKHVFVELGIREHFNIPKLHSMQHYTSSIRQKGTLDGFNTELSERLHIDYAKNAYRAGNRRDYIANMTAWLARQDAVNLRTAYIIWWDARRNSEVSAGPDTISNADPENNDERIDKEDLRFTEPSHPRLYRLAKQCPFPNLTPWTLHHSYGASEFLRVFRTFVRETLHLGLDDASLPSHITRFRVYKQLKLERVWNPFVSKALVHDRVRATPPVPARGRRKPISGRFDTILAVEDQVLYANRTSDLPLDGLRVGRVRVIFELPARYGRLPHPLLYVEWYTPLTRVDGSTQLYYVTRSTRAGFPNASIISADRVVAQTHLASKCGREIDKKWTTDNILDVAQTFYINPYITLDTFSSSSLYIRSRSLL